MGRKSFALVLIFIVFCTLLPIATSQSWKDNLPCQDGETKPCGSNIGACKSGKQLCSGGAWRPCDLEEYPRPEICGDGIDDDCNGVVDDCGDPLPLILVGVGVMVFVFAWVLLRV